MPMVPEAAITMLACARIGAVHRLQHTLPRIEFKTKIADVVEQFAKEIGTTVVLKGFVRYNLGEGIEKEVINFADEVAAVAKQPR
jgi:elongation factor Ts